MSKRKSATVATAEDKSGCASVNGSAAARCKQILSGWRPYWQHGLDNQCGKKAHWLWTSSLRGELTICTRHAKAIGLDKCKPIKPQNDKLSAWFGVFLASGRK